MSGCKRMWAGILRKSLKLMAQRIAELHDLRRQVQEAEARALARRRQASSRRPRSQSIGLQRSRLNARVRCREGRKRNRFV